MTQHPASNLPSSHPVRDLLDPGERVLVLAEGFLATLIVTDHRVAVVSPHRLAMAVTFDRLRRVQWDVERGLPATLSLVPDRPSDMPQVLEIPPDQYAAAGKAVVLIGERLARLSDS